MTAIIFDLPFPQLFLPFNFTLYSLLKLFLEYDIEKKTSYQNKVNVNRKVNAIEIGIIVLRSEEEFIFFVNYYYEFM
jgi:hypothetical protein